MGQKCKFDEYSFEEVGIVEAYFLGLMFSDGCVHQTKNKSYLIIFTSQDVELIDKFREFVKSSNKIHSYGNGNYSICLGSKLMYHTLIKLGCIERKSNSVKGPQITENLYFPFLLGMFDGDGSLTYMKKNNAWKVVFGTGSEKFAIWIAEVLNKEKFPFSTETRELETGKKFYSVVICGLIALKFLQKLYGSVGDKVTPLSRKYEKFKSFSENSFRKGPNFQDWEVELLLNKALSNRKCADMINQDIRNIGWTRRADTINNKRKSLYENRNCRNKVNS